MCPLRQAAQHFAQGAVVALHLAEHGRFGDMQQQAVAQGAGGND
jgi:hypothetical protein